jgi:AraC-like DNA-binding protein
MEVKNVLPIVYNVAYFKHVEGSLPLKKLSYDKTQYSYRFIIVEEGFVDVFVGGKIKRLYAKDALYLLPGESYRLLPCESNFALSSVFFNYLNEEYDSSLGEIVFSSEYKENKALKVINFEDAKVLNNSGIFRNLSLDKVKDLLYINETEEFYNYYRRVIVHLLIAEVLKNPQVFKPSNIEAKKIVNYIKTNPEEQLSATVLSTLFSYHKNYINKLVKNETGKCLNEFIRHVKIEYAKKLFGEGALSLSEISERLGYYDYSHFYKAFIAETQLTPAQYKEKINN